ncbi:YitT family protein [Peptoniphilus equinus]|uniref:YitT family protein n=1 Tax=Peptoniphilus equinus TaxID=3016343 RepID=A0ABY7QV80_9FIRM|nr:YitT family protein [Peptoniphilus equinus]WBW49945.1 YitT family protein [Peptoniphilus equinus]
MPKVFYDFFQINRSILLKLLAGTSLMSFVLVNIHMQSNITEGGVLGLTMLLYKLFGWDPAVTSPLLDFAAFSLGVTYFGRKFLKRTALCSLLFALFYKLFFTLGPVLPNLYQLPAVASILGGLGIGLGCGLIVHEGIAAGGDDALALVLSNRLNLKINRVYFLTDFSILILSLTYIPVNRIGFSLLTTVVSSLVIRQIEVLLPQKNGARSTI